MPGFVAAAVVAAALLVAAVVATSLAGDDTGSTGVPGVGGAGDSGGAGDLIGALVGVGAGVALAVVGVVTARRIRRDFASRNPEIERRAAAVLFGAAARDDLTTSLLVEIDDVLASLRAVDQRVLGMTLRAMVGEFDRATASSDRQSALVNIVTIMEKLQQRLSPWHVRHRDAIATGIAVVGCASGVASAVGGLLA